MAQSFLKVHRFANPSFPKRPESVNGNSGRSLTFAPNQNAAQVSQSVESWLTDFSIFLPFSFPESCNAFEIPWKVLALLAPTNLNDLPTFVFRI